MENRLKNYTALEMLDELRQRILEKMQQTTLTPTEERVTQPTMPQAKEMWPAICNMCGKETKVPFKPNENAINIKCLDCYKATRK